MKKRIRLNESTNRGGAIPKRSINESLRDTLLRAAERRIIDKHDYEYVDARLQRAIDEEVKKSPEAELIHDIERVNWNAVGTERPAAEIANRMAKFLMGKYYLTLKELRTLAFALNTYNGYSDIYNAYSNERISKLDKEALDIAKRALKNAYADRMKKYDEINSPKRYLHESIHRDEGIPFEDQLISDILTAATLAEDGSTDLKTALRLLCRTYGLTVEELLYLYKKYSGREGYNGDVRVDNKEREIINKALQYVPDDGPRNLFGGASSKRVLESDARHQAALNYLADKLTQSNYREAERELERLKKPLESTYEELCKTIKVVWFLIRLHDAGDIRGKNYEMLRDLYYDMSTLIDRIEKISSKKKEQPNPTKPSYERKEWNEDTGMSRDDWEFQNKDVWIP